jgi:NitT/TauT family transport system permease protein
VKTPFEVKNKNLLLGIGIIVPILVWFFISHFGLISKIFLANPIEVAKSLYAEIASGTLLIEIGYTLFRTVIGFLIGSIIGVTVGVLLSTNKSFLLLFTPLIEFLRSIPVLCLFPLFLLFFGIGNVSKIMIAGWSSFFIVVVPTYTLNKNYNC